MDDADIMNYINRIESLLADACETLELLSDSLIDAMQLVEHFHDDFRDEGLDE